MITFKDFVEKIEQIDYIRISEYDERKIDIQVLAGSTNVNKYVINKITSMDIQDCNIKTGNYSTITVCKFKDIPDIIDKATSYEKMVEILKENNINARLCGEAKVAIKVSYKCENELVRLINMRKGMYAHEKYGDIYITTKKCNKHYQRRQKCRDNCLKAEFDEIFDLC